MQIDDDSLTTSSVSGTVPLGDRIGRTSFRLGALATFAYAFATLPVDRVGNRLGLGTTGVMLVFFIGVVLLVVSTRMRLTWLSTTRMLALGVAGVALVLMLLFADLVITVRDNVARSATEDYTAANVRNRDRTLWHGELYPRMYFPSGESFALYKPNVRVTGETYGERYVSAMLASPTLTRSVLERRTLSYFIGPEGLREVEPLARSRIFALGDSFVFGFATDEGKIWPDLVGSSLGEPVYNLGVTATGPRPQLELLRYMLRTYPDTMHVEQLLWMIFEGNDLENSYRDAPIAPPVASRASLFEGTIIEPFLDLPVRLRSESVIGRFLRGELTVSRARRFGQYEVDGVRLPMPLFHSSRFGYRLFYPADIKAATEPRAYVMNHPNRPRLDKTFREMRELSEKIGFKVVVILAPSDARLYGSAFDGFPALSPEPYFINYTAQLAGDMGFRVIDLHSLLRPFANTELLYYRDDHHWNVRGNEVVAQLITAALRPH